MVNYFELSGKITSASQIFIFMPPLKKGAYCFATVGRSVGRLVGRSVGMLVGLSVCRPSVFRSISFDPFTWLISNLVQGLPSMSRWSYWFSGHMFKGQGQTILLSPLCCLTPSLDQYQTWCRSCAHVLYI